MAEKESIQPAQQEESSMMNKEDPHDDAAPTEQENVGADVPEKKKMKKRGRPRKHDSDGKLRIPYRVTTTPPAAFSLRSLPPEVSSKRRRGRPVGSRKLQYHAYQGSNITPHVITVMAGENVAERIHSLPITGSRGIIILSASGAVATATLRHAASSDGTFTYEGRFEILVLSGLLTVIRTGGRTCKAGELLVSLAGPDGRVFGGGVAGALIADGPIQIVLGSFMTNAYKESKTLRDCAKMSMISFAQDATPKPRSHEHPNGDNILNSSRRPRALSVKSCNDGDYNTDNDSPNSPPVFSLHDDFDCTRKGSYMQATRGLMSRRTPKSISMLK